MLDDIAPDPFVAWMNSVDSWLWRNWQVSSADLPDIDYWNLWDDGISPSSAGKIAIENARGY